MTRVNRVGSAFSTLPFDGIDNVSNVFIHEDFIGVDDDGTAGVISTAAGSWTATDTTVTAADGTENHPGIALLEAGFMVPGGVGEPSVVLNADGIYLAMIAGIEDVSVQDIFLGLSETAAVISTQGYVGLESDGSDGEFQLVVDDGTTNGVAAFTLYPGDQDWFVAEVAISDTSVTGRITTANGQETQVLVYNDVASLVPANVAAGPYFPLLASANTGALALDAVHIRARRPEGQVVVGAAYLSGDSPTA